MQHDEIKEQNYRYANFWQGYVMTDRDRPFDYSLKKIMNKAGKKQEQENSTANFTQTFIDIKLTFWQ